MKIPATPPNFENTLFRLIRENPNKVAQIFRQFKATGKSGDYLHWDKIRHLVPPEGFNHEEWWAGIKFARSKLSHTLPYFEDRQGNPFTFANTPWLERELHWITQNASGFFLEENSILNPDMRESFLIRSLVNESIASSQLEGASTTRKIAKEMLFRRRNPRDKSEQMIFNNYHAMQFIQDLKNEPLNPSIIFELQKILTKDTLENPEGAGRFRTSEENILVVDNQDNMVLHVPPPSETLDDRLDRLCRFANEEEGEEFIHPVVKAIILHFMLAYDHPFSDGNGRTARALFYWYALRQKYDLIEYISISEILKSAPGQYKKVFLYVETDQNDLTYFLIHQMDALRKGFNRLMDYLEKENRAMIQAKQMLEKIMQVDRYLNFRQMALLKHALKHPGFHYTIEEHQNTHGVAYQTARTDLLELADKWEFLVKEKRGRTFLFQVPPDIHQRLGGE